MWSYINPAIRCTLVFSVLTGGLYPLAEAVRASAGIGPV